MARKKYLILIVLLTFALRSFSTNPPEKLLAEAMSGNSETQNSLELWYHEHDNNEQAVYWWKLSANQGCPQACTNMGVYCMETKNSEAEYWYLRGAELGSALAMRGLAQYYEQLAGDKYKAFTWYRKAAEANDAKSQYILGIISESEDERVQFLEKACSNGEVKAYNALAKIYMGKKDLTNVAKYCQEGAYKGELECQYILASLYVYGNGVDINHEEARYWFKRSADGGFASAQFELGVCYAEGLIGLQENEEKAKYWFEKAALQGHAQAQNNVGVYYIHHGNKKMAIHWWEKAAKNGDPDAEKYLKQIKLNTKSK